MIRDLASYYEKISRKSEKTQKVVKVSIANFERYCNKKGYQSLEKVIDDLIKADRNEIYDFLQAWINSQDVAPRTIQVYFSQVKKYLRYRGVNIVSDDVKDEIDFPEVPKEELHPIDLETELKPILKICSFKYRAFFLGQASAGFRVGEGAQLRRKHIITDKKRLIIKFPPSIAKFGKARTSILSKEAGLLWIPLLKKLNDEDLIFGVSEKAVQTALRRYVCKLGLDKKYESNGRNQINTHGFRAWFITRMSRKDKDLCSLLAGQKGYLLQYDRLTDDQKLELYLKYEDELLIYDETKKDHKIQELEKINEEYNKMLCKYEETLRQNNIILDRVIQDKTVPI